MRIGAVEIYWSRTGPTFRELIKIYLQEDAIRELFARLARSEVKNYLAELAEQNELPLHGPATFIRNVNAMMPGVASCGYRHEGQDGGDCPYHAPQHPRLSLLCRVKQGTAHAPCSGTDDSNPLLGLPCECECHRRSYMIGDQGSGTMENV
jgi:hypothetical protein